MSVPKNINLETNKNTINYSGITLRQDERNLTIHATLMDENSAPVNLTGKNVVFSEEKENGKWVIDTAVKTINATQGKIDYQLNEQCFASTGRAWFEIVDVKGNVVDTTQDFILTVKNATSASIANTNYYSSAQDLLDKVNGLYQAAVNLSNKFNQQTTNTINDANNKANQQRNQINSQWQSQKAGFDSAFNAFKTEYQKVLNNNKNLDMSRFALKTDLTNSNNRISSLENAGYVPYRWFNDDNEAQKWAREHHGFAETPN